MNSENNYENPRWLRDLLRFLPLKSQFVLSDNVRDLQVQEMGPGMVAPLPMLQFLARELREFGYAHVVFYDPVKGFRMNTLPGEDTSKSDGLLKDFGLQPAQGCAPAGIDLFSETLGRILDRPGEPIAVLADFASRMVVRNDSLSLPEHLAFTRALVHSHSARPRPYGTPSRPFFNTVIWVVEKEGDLPDWFLVGNPRVRHIPIANPDHNLRRVFGASLLRALEGYREAGPQGLKNALDSFVDQTEGLLLLDLAAIVELGRTEKLGITKIADAVRRYKVGVTEDPWVRIDREKIKRAGEFIYRRVKGQDQAVTHVLDIVKRAVTGIGTQRRGSRPRGVAFLAGPTGVGKTELAKTITSLIFGDESAYIRFDMSEFSAEHSDQRLIGAPPGYVGYDVGGELTNSIREKPFSVVLFDEIEKAHPRILDKFLQVLDDGVLTSGRGDRVYFSEAFIVFTSNLGIYRLDAEGNRVPNVSPDNEYAEVQAKVRAEIENHFKVALNRPEILNRIGDNLVVFDFIRPGIAAEIFTGMVDAAISEISANQRIEISLSEESRNRLRGLCLADLSNGGRGIRNKVEKHFLNPLARSLFDDNAAEGAKYRITAVEAGTVTNLTLERHPI